MALTNRIHALGYLVAEEIDLSHLKDDKTAIFDLRAGSEIISASIEVKTQGTGTIDLGIEGDTAFFLNDIDISSKGIHKSRIETMLTEDTPLLLDTTSRTGIIKVRLLYFTSGTIYS